MVERVSNLISGATGAWEIVVGLEVHAQVLSKSKLFSGASAVFGAAPNAHVSLVDAAMPGMLPVINEYAVEQAVRTGLGLNARINLKSVFDRKNYFYPDLPQGYQISQFTQPIVGEGMLVLEMDDGEQVEIKIERLHLEQDAGKSIHDQLANASLVDLNRSGVALMEIVSKPDIRSSAQAQAYVAKVRGIVRALGTCDGNMEEGSLRADVNVSVRRPGEELGTRCELKNLNSIRFIGLSIEHEARRQIDIIEDGGVIDQETRLFDPKSGTTRSMRSKEEAHDYRYFPDPDLLPLEFTQEWVDEIKASLPELPDARRARYIDQFKMMPANASRLVNDQDAADYFEEVLEEVRQDHEGIGLPGLSEEVAKWVLGDFSAILNDKGVGFIESAVTPSANAAIISMQMEGDISRSIARDVLKIVWTDGGTPAEIVEARGLKQMTDTGAIEAVVDEIIAANPDKVAEIKDKPKMIGWFVGQVMQKTGGKANPQAVNEILKARLGLEDK